MVADYGQLELRLLAHIARCESMITAFASGGCFHSRTAMGMFEHVRAAAVLYFVWLYLPRLNLLWRYDALAMLSLGESRRRLR